MAIQNYGRGGFHRLFWTAFLGFVFAVVCVATNGTITDVECRIFVGTGGAASILAAISWGKRNVSPDSTIIFGDTCNHAGPSRY
jgi:hypothetical protein